MLDGVPTALRLAAWAALAFPAYSAAAQAEDGKAKVGKISTLFGDGVTPAIGISQASPEHGYSYPRFDSTRKSP